MSVKKSRRRSDGIWAMVLLAIAALWLAVSFLGLGRLLADQIASDPGSMPKLITSLSSTVIGSAFAGAVAGHLAITMLGRRWERLPRILLAAIGSLPTGAITAGIAYWTFAQTSAVAGIIAGVAGIIALLGGLLAMPRNPNAVTAGLAGTTVLLVFMFLRGWFDEALLNLFARKPDTYLWIGVVGGVVAGMCVGVTGFIVLRRRRGGTKLYGYLGAGAVPGVVWLTSEIAIRIAGSMLMGHAGEVDQLSELFMKQMLEAQLNGSLAALFAGGTTAVLAFGLLMPSAAAKKKKRAEPNRPAGKPRRPSDTKKDDKVSS